MGKIEKLGTLRKGLRVDLKAGEEIFDITPIDVFINGPSGKMPLRLSKEDVWGKWHNESHVKISNGMIVARGYETCPVFNDIVPCKSVTVICDKEQESDVTYWLEYVHGGNCISESKILDDGKIALRSDYMCW